MYSLHQTAYIRPTLVTKYFCSIIVDNKFLKELVSPSTLVILLGIEKPNSMYLHNCCIP